MTIAVIINAETKLKPRDIVQLINIYQAAKEKRAFNVKIAFRARWRREEEDG